MWWMTWRATSGPYPMPSGSDARWQGLVDDARHVTGCHSHQATRVGHVEGEAAGDTWRVRRRVTRGG